MAKKKKASLKPVANRGFATTSTPSSKQQQQQQQQEASSENQQGSDSKGARASTDAQRDGAAQLQKDIDNIVLSGKDDAGDERGRASQPMEFDPAREEEQALQNLVERLRDRVDKDVARLWKSIEYDRRMTKQLPLFDLDDDVCNDVLDYHSRASSSSSARQLLEPSADVSSLFTQLYPGSAASELLQRALITHALLLKLGFTDGQATHALRSSNNMGDVEECVASLVATLSPQQLENAVRRSEGKPVKADDTTAEEEQGSKEEDVDDTRPPEHDAFSFERINAALRRQWTTTSAASQASAPTSTAASSAIPSGATTPANPSPEVEDRAQKAISLARDVEMQCADQDCIDVLEDPTSAHAKARLFLIQLERASSKMAREAKAQSPGSSFAVVEEAKNKVARARIEVERIIDEAQQMPTWEKNLAERQFLKEREAWEASEPKEEEKVIGKEEPYSSSDQQTPAAEGIKEESKPISNGGKGAQSEGEENDDDDEGDEGGMFGDFLDEQPNELVESSTNTTIRVKELPPQVLRGAGGKTPRSILNDALRKVDSYATARFEPVETSSRLFRSRLTLRWLADGVAVLDTYTMTGICTASQTSADDFLAVAALMCVESNAKVQVSTKAMHSTWRDWMAELEQKRKAERDEKRRGGIKSILEAIGTRLVEENVRAEERERKLKSLSSAASVSNGKSSQAEVSHVAQPGQVAMTKPSEASSDVAKSLWQERTVDARFQKMLVGRQSLPIAAYKDTILDIMHKDQVFVLSGETGCGKSTQVPAYILEHCLSQGQPCKIYVTEPRRISAISLAERVSAEMGEARGSVGKDHSLIGSAVRLESNVGKNARLVYATTGIVLRMLEGSRLEGVTHIILDEVHERSIESDFLLIILKSLLEVRPDLKVILMSATLDAERLSAYFGGCPTISVPGRTFPVEVRYLEDAVQLCNYTLEDGSPYMRRERRGRKQDAPGNKARLLSTEAESPPELDDSDEEEGEEANRGSSSSLAKKYTPKTINTLDRMNDACVNHELIIALLEQICFEDKDLRGYSAATLVFLPGLADIRKLHDLLNVHSYFGSKAFRIHALHSSIASEQQGLVFDVPPEGVRKVVLSTNIAETGVTIPDITCVIDSGRHREMRFDEKRQMSRLLECFVAQSNAKQRRGRAGRVQQGLCFHLFTKFRHDKTLAEHPLPEMLRLSLQDLALKLKVMKVKIGNTVEEALAKALDPPSSINIQRAVSALIEVKALTSNEEITALGRHLSRLPLDVHMGKFLLVACTMRALDPALTIAATLNSKSPFVAPFGREAEAERAKQSFNTSGHFSDFITYARAFSAWRRATDNNVARSFCNASFLSSNNLQQIEELRQQYMAYLVDSGFVYLDPNQRQELLRLKRGKLMRLPEHLDDNANSLAILHSALVAGLYPKLLSMEPNTKSNQLRTLGNNAPASIHPSSVNFGLRMSELPRGIHHLVYFSIMQSKRLYAWETGAVDDRCILLLCGDADFKFSSGSLYVDRSRIRVRTWDLRKLLVIKLLREQIGRLINASFKSP